MSFKIYNATAPITLHAGVVKIEPAQYKRRRHLLKSLDSENFYSIDPGPITFKAGEVFEYNGEIPKGSWESVEPEPDPEPEPKPKPKPKGKAAEK